LASTDEWLVNGKLILAHAFWRTTND